MVSGDVFDYEGPVVNLVTTERPGRSLRVYCDCQLTSCNIASWAHLPISGPMAELIDGIIELECQKYMLCDTPIWIWMGCCPKCGVVYQAWRAGAADTDREWLRAWAVDMNERLAAWNVETARASPDSA